MRIKLLEIDNFKSFANKNVIPFLDGFTVVSGPNGSGKSNIIDCILCVEQSLRRIPSLRFIGFLHSGRCGFTVCILSNYK